jgi:ribosomal protein S18 acetylase RimI-like enzyme
VPALNLALLRLRPATPDDREFVWRLHRETMRVYVDRTWGWDDRWQRERFDGNFDPALLQIIEYCSHMAGYMSVRRSGGEIFLAVIEIAPEYQNQGIGTRLIASLLDESDSSRLPAKLSVLKVNPARRLYERLGFDSIAETSTHYEMRREPRAPSVV